MKGTVIMLLAIKNITVVGMGISGVATAIFLVSQKACVTLVDSKSRVMLEKNIQSSDKESIDNLTLNLKNQGFNLYSFIMHPSTRENMINVFVCGLAKRFR